MKRLLAFILAFTMLSTTVAFAECDGLDIRYTEHKSKTDEAWLWHELNRYSPSEYITAGILGYFWRESQYRSDVVAGCYISLKGTGRDLCKEMIEKVDPGLIDGSSKEIFLKLSKKYGGYGLGQWCSHHYLEDLYGFASDYGTSIGDARMQCKFIFLSLQKDEKLWAKLLKCHDAERTGRLIGIYYDGTEHGAPYIGYKAQKLYEKYSEEDGA